MLPVVTSSFHGRDIFSPVAAHLAMGAPFEAVGPTVPASVWSALAEPTPTVGDGRLDTVIVQVMIFGNVTFAGRRPTSTAAVGPLAAGTRASRSSFPDGDGRRRPSRSSRTRSGEHLRRVSRSVRPLLMADSEGQLRSPTTRGMPLGGSTSRSTGRCDHPPA